MISSDRDQAARRFGAAGVWTSDTHRQHNGWSKVVQALYGHRAAISLPKPPARFAAHDQDLAGVPWAPPTHEIESRGGASAIMTPALMPCGSARRRGQALVLMRPRHDQQIGAGLAGEAPPTGSTSGPGR